MPEELLHEREYTRTGIAPAGSNLALMDTAADEDDADGEETAARRGSDAELGAAGTAGAQNGHADGGRVSPLG